MKHTREILLFIGIFLSVSLFSQNTPILVAESTFKIGGMGDEEFYYGFAEGDQIIFDFEEVNKKELKEIEIIEYPSSSKFMDYKTVKITNKVINVTSTGIYKFRFSNSAIGGRVCKYKIQRIPVSDGTKNFNTSVYWKTLTDTTFYMVDEKYLISIDTLVVPIIQHRIERVHSQTNMNHLNKSTVAFIIPENTISWSYYIGVGESSEAIFKQAEEKAKKTKEQLNAASNITNVLAKFDPSGSVALATLALKGYAEFGVLEQADNIQYWFVPDYQNSLNYMQSLPYTYLIKGDGPLIKGRFTSPLKGTVYLCLKNDNIKDGLDIHIRASAVTVKENWGTRQVQKYKVKSWKEPYLK